MFGAFVAVFVRGLDGGALPVAAVEAAVVVVVVVVVVAVAAAAAAEENMDVFEELASVEAAMSNGVAFFAELFAFVAAGS